MRAPWLAVAAVALGTACGSTVILDPNGTAGPVGGGGAAGAGAGGTGGSHAAGTGGTHAGGTGGTGTGGIAPPTDIAECAGYVYECGDLLDNDGDRLVDSLDPDCLGACDDTEDSFYCGFPECEGAPCVEDCHFDADSGTGDDDCRWDHRCDPLSVAPHYYPEPWEGDTCAYLGPDHVVSPIDKTCDELLHGEAQSPQCRSTCLPLTPNGCDCFGCCELPAGSGRFIYFNSRGADDTTVCTLAEVANPAVCHPCTPVTDCRNDCRRCELCVGKPTRPPDCDDPTGILQCPGGEQPCGLAGQPACASGHYCITGCCQPLLTWR